MKRQGENRPRSTRTDTDRMELAAILERAVDSREAARENMLNGSRE
jgi:hypothetical protein